MQALRATEPLTFYFMQEKNIDKFLGRVEKDEVLEAFTNLIRLMTVPSTCSRVYPNKLVSAIQDRYPKLIDGRQHDS